MTTKPTARKFRIRRAPAEAKATNATSAQSPAPDTRQATAAAAAPQKSSGTKPAPQDMATQIEAIRREGLTGRQLRMARRVAQKNGLAPTSDIDAVRLLRQRGIDPFKRANMLELVVQGEDQKQAQAAEEKVQQKVQLPQTVPDKDANLPSSNVNPVEQRNREISEIQADITRRRRRKLRMLGARLGFFVLLPTLLAGWYFFAIATPMYATKSEFLILQADSQGGSGLGGLLTGTQFATSQDSIAVQSFLQSKDAMLRLDSDVGFKSHFTQEFIDPIQRLGDDPSNEEAYKSYQKKVKVGYDPTEGVLRMEVIAADPETSARFSEALIQYAEERVNTLSEKKRGDQMSDAQASFEKAEAERREAQEALVKLQLEGATLDPEAVIASLRQQISNVEIQILEKELQLAALLDNARPNQSRVDGARGDIRRINAQLADLNARMTDASQGQNSLAQLSVRIQMAQADLATRDMLLQSALQQMEQTRMEANRQVRYLTTSVQPVPPEEASYPRSFENTVLAFLIFAGIYLMVSLTASILREQVTS
jgi:capsular polysaccharide transport system permease protein